MLDIDNDIDIRKLDNMLPFKILNNKYLEKYSIVESEYS